MKRRELFVCLLLCAWAAGCGGTQPVPAKIEPPKPPVTPLAWLPAASQMVGRVKLEPWRSTPLWSLWQEQQAKLGAWSTWFDVTLADELAVGGEPPGDQGPSDRRGSFVVAAKGRFGAGYLAKLAARDHVPVEQHGAHTFYAVQEVRFLQTSPEVIVVCSPDRAEFVAGRATQGGEGIAVAERELVVSLGQRLGLTTADLVLMASDAAGQGKNQLERQGDRLGLAPLARDVLRAGLAVDLGPTAEVVFSAQTPDAATARHLKEAVDETLSSLSRNMIVGILGLRRLVQALKPSVEGLHVTVRGALADEEVQAVLSKAASMLEVATQQGGAFRLSP